MKTFTSAAAFLFAFVAPSFVAATHPARQQTDKLSCTYGYTGQLSLVPQKTDGTNTPLTYIKEEKLVVVHQEGMKRGDFTFFYCKAKGYNGTYKHPVQTVGLVQLGKSKTFGKKCLTATSGSQHRLESKPCANSVNDALLPSQWFNIGDLDTEYSQRLLELRGGIQNEDFSLPNADTVTWGENKAVVVTASETGKVMALSA